MPRTVWGVLRRPWWLPAVALFVLPGTATGHALAAPLVVGYRLTFAGSAVWRQTEEAGAAYSAGGGRTVYTARITWMFVFPLMSFRGYFAPVGVGDPGTGSWLRGGWTTAVGRGGPAVESGCAGVTFSLVASHQALFSFGQGGHLAMDAEVPLPGSLEVSWKSPCDTAFVDTDWTWTPTCPASADSRDFAFIPFNPSSVPPAHKSAAFSVTCDTGHAEDIINFPMVDNYLHWSGTLDLTRLST
jgi:hypothetical protein